MKQISPIITKAIGRSVEDPMQGRFYLLGQPCVSISVNQEPGTADYTCRMFKKHLLSTLGQTLCPRNGEDIVPVPKELEVQPRRWMGNQRHTFGVKRVKVGRGCAAHFGKSGNASWRK